MADFSSTYFESQAFGSISLPVVIAVESMLPDDPAPAQRNPITDVPQSIGITALP